MTILVMGYVVKKLVMEISKEVFTVGKRFSMVANLIIRQFYIFVEKMSAIHGWLDLLLTLSMATTTILMDTSVFRMLLDLRQT